MRLAALLFLVFALPVIVACGADEDDGFVESPPAWPTREQVTGASSAAPTVFSEQTATPPPTVSPTPPPTAGSVASAPAPAGCQFPYDALGRTRIVKLVSDGVDREFMLNLPESESEARNGPVVLNFHGLGSNMGEQLIYSGLGPIAEREGFVLVTPNGTGSPRAWQSFGLPGGVDDIQFVRDILAVLETGCIDTDVVFATGMSNGAFMSSYLACRAPELVKAIAPVAGVFMPRQGCAGRTAVLAFHGTEDALVPYEAGEVFNLIPYAGAERSTYEWAVNNGCAPNTGKADIISPSVYRADYAQCGGGADVSLVTVTGGGHTWPGTSIDRPNLGTVNRDISASEMAWEFFEDHASR